MRRHVIKRWGGTPGQLLATVASLAIAAAGFVGWTQDPGSLKNVLEWFVAAILLHDLVVVPVYTLADRLTIGFLPRASAVYVRVPLLISGLVLAVTFPTVLGYGARTAGRVSAIPEHGYLLRWLIMTGILFGLSGLAFALRGRSTDQ